MLRAQKAMRDEMAKTSLLQIVEGVPAPPGFGVEVGRWLDDRIDVREQARVAGMKRREPVR